MVESSTPCWAAVVAAPILKLCPEKGFGSIPADIRAFLTSVTKRGLVRGLPSWKMNRGPGLLPLITMYANKAETGQRGLLVQPTYTSTP